MHEAEKNYSTEYGADDIKMYIYSTQMMKKLEEKPNTNSYAFERKDNRNKGLLL